MKIKKTITLLLFITIFKCGHSQIITDTLVIYPNPLNSTGTIRFDLANNDTVTINIFDATGRNVRSYFNKTLLPTGSYSVSFMRDTLHDGIYFVQLLLGNSRTFTKKMLLVSTSGVSQLTDDNEMKIYPNPTSAFLNFSMDGMKSIVITNLLGQKIKSFNTGSKTISVSELDAGSYFICIYNEDNVLVSKNKFVLLK